MMVGLRNFHGRREVVPDGNSIHEPQKDNKNKAQNRSPALLYGRYVYYYNFGPAATRFLPASLPVNLAKFLMKRPAKSFAFSSHCAASA